MADSPESLLQSALSASQANDVEQAIDYFERASAAAPGWAIPQFLLGSEHAARGALDKAEAAMANAVLLDPGLAIARYQLGLLQYSSGRAAVALVTWNPLLNSAVEEGLAHFVRGFAALAQDQLAEAQAHFSAGLEAPAINPAVAGDIRKVLAGLANLSGGAGDASTAAPAESQAHVLVSAYAKYKMH